MPGLALRALFLALALAEVDIGREGGVSAVGLLAGEGGRLGRRRVRHSMPWGTCLLLRMPQATRARGGGHGHCSLKDLKEDVYLRAYI